MIEVTESDIRVLHRLLLDNHSDTAAPFKAKVAQAFASLPVIDPRCPHCADRPAGENALADHLVIVHRYADNTGAEDDAQGQAWSVYRKAGLR